MISTLFYLAVIVATFFMGISFLRGTKFRFPLLTVSLGVLLAICLVAQLSFPHLLEVFERNTVPIHNGDWWRIFTALFFQDGGLVGGISNILLLGMIGTVAEQFWNKRQWLALYFVGGIASEFVALIWQPIGAGNSIAFFSLAASIIVYVLLRQRKPLQRILAAVAILSAVALFVMQDIHGAAFFIGILISLFLYIV